MGWSLRGVGSDVACAVRTDSGLSCWGPCGVIPCSAGTQGPTCEEQSFGTTQALLQKAPGGEADGDVLDIHKEASSNPRGGSWHVCPGPARLVPHAEAAAC